MPFLKKTKKIVLHSTTLRDELLEKLQNAHVPYTSAEDKVSVFSSVTDYIVTVNEEDLRKIG